MIKLRMRKSAPEWNTHLTYQTDITRLSTGGSKNLYGQPSLPLGVVGDSHLSRSNGITLALALLQKFNSPPVLGPTSGKTLFNLTTLV